MGKVVELGIREKRYEYEQCGGCQKEVIEQQEEDYMEVVIPYGEYDKHIILCESCYGEAKRHGVVH
jgi:uncharacterized protein with PIN domain